MRYEMVQCDICCTGTNVDGPIQDDGWAETKDGLDLCPDCADARAVDAEHDLDEMTAA